MNIQDMKDILNLAAAAKDSELLLIFLAANYDGEVLLHDVDKEDGNCAWCCHLGEDGHTAFRGATPFKALAHASAFLIRSQERAQDQARTS